MELSSKVGDGLKGYGIQAALRELYVDTYNLTTLDDKNRPWALVSDSPKDGLRKFWPLYVKMNRYALYEIDKHWGLSMVEFFGLPREFTDHILQTQGEKIIRENAAREAARAKAAADAAGNRSPVDASAFSGLNIVK
jgi:hypothetical protein